MNTSDELDPYLRPDEHVLWVGRPDPTVWFCPLDGFLIPFSLLWCGFALFWEATVLAEDATVIFKLWGLPFVALGLYLIFGRFAYKRWRKERTLYAVTDQRGIVLVDGRSLTDSPLKYQPVNVRRSRDGLHASVVVGNTGGGLWRGPARYANTGMDWFGAGGSRLSSTMLRVLSPCWQRLSRPGVERPTGEPKCRSARILIGHDDPVRASLRSVDLSPDPRTLPADPAQFRFLARLMVGPADGPGEESLDVTVCSPEWLAARSTAEGLVDVRHHLVVTVDQYDEGRLQRWFAERVGQVEGPDWPAIGSKAQMGRARGHPAFEGRPSRLDRRCGGSTDLTSLCQSATTRMHLMYSHAAERGERCESLLAHDRPTARCSASTARLRLKP